MSTTNARLHIIDENGDAYDVHQQTSIPDVEGLQAVLNEKANTSDVTSGLAGKVDTETGKGLSTNDYTTAEKNKLAGIEAQANKTVVDSVLSSSSTNPVQNKIITSALDAIKTFSTPEMYNGETDDDRFDAMFNDENAENIRIDGVYNLSRFHLSRYAKSIYGCGKIINKTKTTDINYLFEFLSIEHIEGITFDSNHESLGSIYAHGLNNVFIENCAFFGYAENVKDPEYTEGGQILVKDTGSLNLKNNVFKDNGHAAETVNTKLNRCITFSGDSNSCYVSDCIFENVNQAIVTGVQVNNVIVHNNYFKNVSDNVFYHLSSGLAIFTNNKCDSCTDECVVAINAVISDNLIINQGNYIFSQNGDSDLVQIKNNVVFKNIGEKCNILRSRDENYTCDSLQFIGNNISLNTDVLAYMFNNYNVNHLIITDNIMNLRISSSGTIFNGTAKKISVFRNTIINDSENVDEIQLINVPTEDKSMFNDNNISDNIRPINDISLLENSVVYKRSRKWWFGNDNVPNIIYGYEVPENAGIMSAKNGTLFINLNAQEDEAIISIYHNEWRTII